MQNKQNLQKCTSIKRKMCDSEKNVGLYMQINKSAESPDASARTVWRRPHPR